MKIALAKTQSHQSPLIIPEASRSLRVMTPSGVSRKSVLAKARVVLAWIRRLQVGDPGDVFIPWSWRKFHLHVTAVASAQVIEDADDVLARLYGDQEGFIRRRGTQEPLVEEPIKRVHIAVRNGSERQARL